MDKTLAILGILTLALIAVTAGMVIMSAPAAETPFDNVPPAPGNPAIPNDPTTSYGIHNEALTLAKQFVMDDPTFKFDGMVETLKVELDESSDPVIAIVDFTSRQAGYGDRTGMMLAQVLTPHKCVLKISQGQVQSAVMDGTWDMISQKEITK
jgi:hypothetical protein